MFGKTKYDEKGNEILAVLSPEDYWEWRTSVEEMEHAKTKYDLYLFKLRIMEKDIRLLQLETALFKSTIKQMADEKDLMKEEYNKFKTKLENKYGLSLSDCLIRDTLEIVKAPIKEDANGTS